MSDEAPVTRDAIADAITADLSAMDKAQAAPPAPEVPAAAETKAPEAPAAAPALAAQQDAPQAKTLADTDLVIDPADGQARKWGEIKAERLRQADYTKKTMAIAEERRQIEALKAQYATQQQLAELAAKQQQLPELPEDDPYAQRIKALAEQQNAIAQYQMTMQQQMQEQMQARELEASRMALEAKEKQLAADHGLNARELELVEREYYFRSNAGEQVDLDSVAKEHAAWRAALKEEAVKEFKSKHLTNTPAATVSVPAAGTPDTTPVPGSRSFADAIREEIGALMR